MLVVEDPAAVENEPVPNGFVFVSENEMRLVQMDSVWDVAPSPDWRRAAFGRAYRVHSSGADTAIPAAALASLAARLGMSMSDVRAGSFSISGMASMWGFAQPGVVDLSGERKLFRLAAGWRVGWSVDGSRLLAGTGPKQRAMDDAPAERWVALEPADGTPRGGVPTNARLAQVTWTEGPVIDISAPLDSTTHVSLPIDGGNVESSGGRIRVNGRDIGPGLALVAARGGRFIAALAPDPEVGEYEAKYNLVVYTVAR